jgi:hypothetical protein
MSDFENPMEIIMRSENTKNQPKGMIVKSSVKAGGDQINHCTVCNNHNETLSREAKSLRVKSNVKAGFLPICHNHNQTIMRGLRVKSNVKAGIRCQNHNQTLALDARSSC